MKELFPPNKIHSFKGVKIGENIFHTFILEDFYTGHNTEIASTMPKTKRKNVKSKITAMKAEKGSPKKAKLAL